MKKKGLLFLVVCCLNGLTMHLKAESVTYNFSSVEYWVTEPNGSTHPKTGTSALLTNIYYVETNDCFVGKGEIHFNKVEQKDEWYLMLKPGASLKIPSKSGEEIDRIILHSHSGASTSVKVNIFTSHGGSTEASEALKWETKDMDYEYQISSSYRKSDLYIRTSNSYNARITSVTIVYKGGIALPTFSIGSTTFSSESLGVTISASAGCDIYYTIDGTTPSYTDETHFHGIKGNEVTIYASDSPTTLKAIAVDPTTGKCSEVSSATYVYAPVPNDGSYEHPYTASEVKAMTEFPEKKIWVKGTICGVLGENYNDFIASNINKSDNLALGDGITYIAVQLTDGEMKDDVNLKNHSFLLGKEMLVQGVIEEYFGKPGVKYPTQYEIAYDVPINSYGYASLFLDMPVSVPQGAAAYYCCTEGDWVNLFPIGVVVPNNTGVVITATPDSKCRFAYTTQLNADEALIQSKNQLIGFVEDFEVVADGNAYYALNAKEGRVAFYIPQTAVSANDATAGFVAKANKAYLKVSESTRSTTYALQRGSETSDIAPIAFDSGCVVCDLQGRAVVSPTAGIYIVNGKKIVVRK